MELQNPSRVGVHIQTKHPIFQKISSTSNTITDLDTPTYTYTESDRRDRAYRFLSMALELYSERNKILGGVDNPIPRQQTFWLLMVYLSNLLFIMVFYSHGRRDDLIGKS